MGKKEVTPEEWIAALESGEYKKARNALRNPRTGGMCCIGVLHDLCGTLRQDQMNYNKTFHKELLPEWTGDMQRSFTDEGERVKNLNRLAAANDKQGGYPIELIREMYLQS